MLKNLKKLDRKNLKKIKGGVNKKGERTNGGYCHDGNGGYYYISSGEVCPDGSDSIN
jgi:hypothetical protein